MGKFASTKIAVGICDRCGFRYPIRTMRTLVVKTKSTNMLVCSECWEEDHPQLLVGMYPVSDPQALRVSRPDAALDTSRVYQWGWAPVGGASGDADALTPNALVARGDVGDVVVTT